MEERFLYSNVWPLLAKKDQLFNQYEIALFTNNTDTLQKFLNHIKSLKSSDVSKNISSFGGFNLLSEDELYWKKTRKATKLKFPQNNS